MPRRRASGLSGHLPRRYVWFVAQAALIFAAAAVVYSFRTAPDYRAVARVSAAGPASLSAELADANRHEARLAGRARVAAGLAASRSVASVEAETRVRADPAARAVRFEVEDSGAAAATRLANAYADQFLVLEASRGLHPQAVHASGAAKLWPSALQDGLVGAGLGALIALALALVGQTYGSRVQSPRAVGARLRMPSLATIAVRSDRLREARDIAVIAELPPEEDSAIASALTRLKPRLEASEVRSIFVTSPSRGEDRSTVAADLAVALARSGRRVALIDLDVEAPTFNRLVTLPRRGFADLALGSTPVEDLLVTVPLEEEVEVPDREGAASPGRQLSEEATIAVARRAVAAGLPDLAGPLLNRLSERRSATTSASPPGTLELLPIGSRVDDARELVGSGWAGTVLRVLRRRVDDIVVDGPPLVDNDAAVALRESVDGILLVIQAAGTTKKNLNALAGRLAALDAVKLGYVVVENA